MAVLGLTSADDPDVEIKAPTLNATKLSAYGAAIVAIGTPLLSWISDQPEAIKTSALMISIVAIPSLALVVATDIASRAYVTAHKPPDAQAASAESATRTGFAVAMSSRDVNVKASGLGDASLRLLAIRRDPTSKGWEYLVGGADKLEWMDASKVDQYLPPST
jgi:hypothetical protein